MSCVQEVNPRVRGIRAPTSLQSLAARITEEISQVSRRCYTPELTVQEEYREQDENVLNKGEVLIMVKSPCYIIIHIHTLRLHLFNVAAAGG